MSLLAAIATWNGVGQSAASARVRAGTLLALAVAAVGYVGMHDPALTGNTPPCPALWLTGWQCPGCGTLRSLHSALNGNVHRAWSYNPAAVLTIPVAAWWALETAAIAIDAPRPPRMVIRPWMPRLLAAAVVAWWIGRNAAHWL